MKAELAAWNGGSGIDLESWIGCEGRFALAVGYATVFWPEFEAFERYVLSKGFTEDTLRGFEREPGATRESVEKVMNHLHLADLQHRGCADVSADKLVVLGRILKEIYEAKLRWQFPERRFEVSFYQPDDPLQLDEYQLLFWQV